MRVLFISDLHLADEPSPLRQAFLQFLRGPAREAAAVYILGDLFNYWIGDDIGLPQYPEEVAALRALTDGGVRVYYMAGNRDFMLGKDFFAATGIQALQDPTLIPLGGRRTLLSHGDFYCTDDVALQRWRRFSANPIAQWVFMHLPHALRLRIAMHLRKGSRRVAATRPQIMDVNAGAIERAMKSADADILIHGHTHRPAEHPLRLEGRDRRRIVLADWHGDRGEYLECADRQVRRVAVTAAG